MASQVRASGANGRLRLRGPGGAPRRLRRLRLDRSYGGGGQVAPYKLSWAPPALTDPITVMISDTAAVNKATGAAVSLSALSLTQDYRLLLPGAIGNTLQAKPRSRPLVVTGGRNITMIGGAIRIDVDAYAGKLVTGPDRASGNRAFYLKDWTGVLHVEGVYVGGEQLYEAFNISTTAPTAKMVTQNVYVDDIILKTPYPGGSHDGGDSMQNWDGPLGGYYVDYHSTRCSTYQGFFLQPDEFDTGAPAVNDFRHVDIDYYDVSRFGFRRQPWPYGGNPLGGTPHPAGNKLFHMSGGGNVTGTGPMNLADFWINPNPDFASGQGPQWAVSPDPAVASPNKSSRTVVDGEVRVSWPGLAWVNGHLKIGRPPGGSFVKPEYVGRGYISPGYLGPTPGTEAPADTTAPTITAFTATPGDGQVSLSWAATDNVAVTGYTITRDGAQVYSGTGTSYVDSGRTNGTPLTYVLTATDAAGNASSQTLTATPAAPTGDTPASAGWDFTGGTMSPTSGSGLTASPLSLTGGSLSTFETQSPSPSYASAPVLVVAPFASNTTSAQSIAGNRFFNIPVEAPPGKVFDPDQLVIRSARGGSSTPRGYTVRSSADGYAADLFTGAIGTQRASLSVQTISLASIAPVAGPLNFRVYPWAPTSGASIDIDTIELTGVTRTA